MNDKDLKRHSWTDRAALEAMTDEEIDYSDVPPLDAHFFDRAMLRLPEQKEVIVTMQVDPDVFAWFDAQKDGWERRMRAALRIYVEAHKEQEAAQAA
jgi:uncharacterized protein (DUF4415 family)